MANLLTQYSFEIKNLTYDEVKWIREYFGVPEDEGNTQEEIEIIEGADEEHGDCCEDGYEASCEEDERSRIEWKIQQEGQQTLLWIYAEEFGEVSLVVDFLQEFLAACRPEQAVAFEWAGSCHKPVLDAFSGGAAVVTANNVYFLNTGQWLYKKLFQLGYGLRYTPERDDLFLENVEVYEDGIYSTTNGFWTCRCPKDSSTYIHSMSEKKCLECGEEMDVSPNALISELIEWPHHHTLDRGLFARVLAQRPRRKARLATVQILMEDVCETEAEVAIQATLNEWAREDSRVIDWGFVQDDSNGDKVAPVQVPNPYCPGELFGR